LQVSVLHLLILLVVIIVLELDSLSLSNVNCQDCQPEGGVTVQVLYSGTGVSREYERDERGKRACRRLSVIETRERERERNSM
jgi:hypothetical protein